MLLVAWAIVLAPRAAGGTDQNVGARPTQLAATSRSRVHWKWRRAATWEYFAAGIAISGGLYLRFWGPQASVNWRGGILFDDAVLDHVAIDNLDNRDAMQLAGNIVFGGAMAYRLVDSLVLPLTVHDDSDLALQMSMTDLEAFGTVAAVLWGSQVFVVRERPIVTRRCGDPTVQDEISECAPDSREPGRSFIAGHTATVLAAAGVTCLHHSHMPLYGGAADTVACASMITASAFSAVSRFTTEAHYPSDVVFGLLLGAGAGWAVPMALHYGFGGGSEADAAFSVVPWMAQDGSGVTLLGTF